jgi:hypothetical protein
MRELVVLCSVLAGLAFLCGFGSTLPIPDATLELRLTAGVMTAFVTFAAALGLGLRDWAVKSIHLRRARKHLLQSMDTSDEAFCCGGGSVLLLDIRRAIAQFFDVPASKVRRDVDLVRDLGTHCLEPDFHFSVVQTVLATQNVEPRDFWFTMQGVTTIDALAEAIEDVLREWKSKPENRSPYVRDA